MKTSISRLQFEQITGPLCEGSMASSFSQPLHWKFIVGLMKPLLVILLLTVSVQAQTLAEIARKERERQRQTKLKPAIVIVATGSSSVATTAQGSERPQDSGGASAASPNPAAPATAPEAVVAKPDPVALYNAELDRLRARIEELQDQETALQLQVNQLTNQIFATIVDQAAKDQAQARLGQVQQTLTLTRAELDQTRKTLNSMQLQGPPRQ
jgi:predicted DNA-binding protein (UPF0251 family)